MTYKIQEYFENCLLINLYSKLSAIRPYQDCPQLYLFCSQNKQNIINDI